MTSMPNENADREHENAQREKLLLDLISGKIDPESEEGRDLLRRYPELQEGLSEIENASDRLAGAATKIDEALEELGGKDLEGREHSHSDAVDEALQRLWDTPMPVPGRIHRTPWKVLIPAGLAAAAVLLLLFTLMPDADLRTDGPIQYLGDKLIVTSLQGSVDRYTFAWEAFTLPSGGYFAVFIDLGTGPLKAWQGVDISWEPTDAQQAELPDSILWWVEAYEPNGMDPIAFSDPVRMNRNP